MHQGVAILAQHLILQLGLLVATRGSLLLHLLYALLDGLEILDLQLGIDDFLVAHGVHGAVHVGHVVVVEAAQHVDDGIRLADVGQELVAQSLTLAGALHESCNVDNLHRGGHYAPRVHQLSELSEPLIGHGDDAHVGLDSTEGEVCRLRLGVRQTVEEGRLAHVGQSHDSTLQCHVLFLIFMIIYRIFVFGYKITPFLAISPIIRRLFLPSARSRTPMNPLQPLLSGRGDCDFFGYTLGGKRVGPIFAL